MKHGILIKNWRKLEDATRAIAELSTLFINEMKKEDFSDEVIGNASNAFVPHIADAIVNQMIFTQIKEEQDNRGTTSAVSPFG